jgi:23S rRNA (cytidine1920-2'-O)/16S rRNA (cytidine1409-2'-O)-methyltransferase
VKKRDCQRIDLELLRRGLVPSRQRARALIMAGRVLVNQRPVDKAGAQVCAADDIQLRGGDLPYVSRGGLKLEKALRTFPVSAEKKICLDIGASTGGFTDCLLQHGAQRVYAVDVGYGQMAWKLRQDPRVVVIERTNIRHMPADRIAEPVDLITIDTSFISLKIVIPAALSFLAPAGSVIALVKPQFEVGKGKVGKGGVVRDPSLHAAVIEELRAFITDNTPLEPADTVPSPILGPKGNREFILFLKTS